MTIAERVVIGPNGLVLRGSAAFTPVVTVHLEGQHIWSFDPSADGHRVRSGAAIEWPAVLAPYLNGRGRVRVVALSETGEDGAVLLDTEHDFGDPASWANDDQRVAFVSTQGHPYAIDKMGHLTHSFESTDAGIKAEILVGTQTVIRELRERCGVEAFLCYGALLGAVREGGMIGHDSDTDIVYFSEQSAPVGLIRETYKIERELRGLGWEILRMSGGDLKVIWALSDGRNCHIDIFSSFYAGERLYMLGEHGEPFSRDDLLPLSTVTMDGYEFPAPANPEAMLVYLYGESWRVPDPAFTPYIDPAIMRRLDGWLRGFRTHMGQWTPLLRGSAAKGSKVPRGGSEFAAWVNNQIGATSKVAELGAGNGRDSVWFVTQGHTVRSSDYSRRSAVELRRLKAAAKLPDPKKLTAKRVIMNETRYVFHLIAELSRDPHHLYARHLLGCLDRAARENLWRLGSASLRGSDEQGPLSLWLEFSAAAPGAPDPAPAGLVRRLDVKVISAEIVAAGGVVEYADIAPGRDMFDNADPAVARMRVTWPDTKETH